MNKDLRMYLEYLEKEKPESIVRIKKEVSPEFEIPVILKKIEDRKKNPVLVFEKVRNLKGEISKMPVVINLFGSRDRLADALGSTKAKLAEDYIAKESPISPVIIDKNMSAVKQVIKKGEEVDLYEFPIITHHEMDLGPYITAGSVWMKDPETGFINCSIVRIFVDGPKRVLVNFNAARHAHFIFKKYKALGINMPMAIVIGHHPAFYLGAQTKLSVNEPDIIGGIMGEPLELVPSEMWGDNILVPAQADMIIEAELSITEEDIEAPFGEFTQYYGGQKLNPVAEVQAVTYRNDAVYLDIMPGYADHLLIDIPPIEAYLLNKIREAVPGVTGVHVPMSGTARLHAYVQVKKSNDAEPKTIICSAISSDYRIKHVIVVDEDIDIYDEEQVLWAVATRSQWDKDLVVVPGMIGSWLDPTADNLTTAKGGIDATKPVGSSDFPKKIELPQSVVDRIKLEDYLD